MDISIEAFRNRIGTFNSTGHFSYLPERKQSSKSSTATIYNFRKLSICLVLMISIISRIENLPKFEPQEQNSKSDYFGSLSTATDPVNFLIFGGQVSACLFPALHLSYHD